MGGLSALLLFFLLQSASLTAARVSRNSHSRWDTLTAQTPRVIARGGFSGILPDSSYDAYALALSTGLSDLILWCDVQLTKDRIGICFSNLTLDTSSNIATVYQESGRTYTVDGANVTGYFPVDFTLKDLSSVSLTQAVLSRTPKFDSSAFDILTVEDVAKFKAPGLWLNFQNVSFYQQFNLSMRSYVISLSKRVVIDYISSSDVDFLRSISKRISIKVTKLILHVLGQNETEPSTNKPYHFLLQNLTLVKSFASGILVPKSVIWPVNVDGYLQAHTSFVAAAHREGLEVFAFGFANDNVLAYNFSYDAVAEYKQFVDYDGFSVDGVLSDFPLTASAAIDCFSKNQRSNPGQGLLVISHHGSSGDYPGCTTDAYNHAILDGAEIIDCSVQMTQDSVAFCAPSINLMESTNAAETTLMNLIKTIPELQVDRGICTFDVTWNDIQQKLKPQISNPYNALYNLERNPAFKNSGNLLNLSQFLDLAKNSNVSGVLIRVEHVAYLADRSLDVIGAVLDALKQANYERNTTKRVMIESKNSSVLHRFKQDTAYELVYLIPEEISNVSNSAMEDIRNFSHSVTITKDSVYPASDLFIIRASHVVQRLQSHNLSVYVRLFRNEFVSQAWDFLSDSTVEINTYVMDAKINGLITDYPKTAAAYKGNKCLGMSPIPSYMSPVQPGSLLELMIPQVLPPAKAPSPELSDREVEEPPLPAVSPAPSPAQLPSPPAAEAPTNSSNGNNSSAVGLPLGQPQIVAAGLAILLVTAYLH